jgi:glycosyltransferase involved in cell wall biosynthesis
MYYLINPAGRIVSLTEEQYERYKTSEGFSVPSPEQITEFQKSQLKKVRTMKDTANGPAVYLATVTGGSDGYGMASKHLIREMQKLELDVSVENKEQRVGILFHNPYSIVRMTNEFKIIYTMFESTKIPEEWIEYLKHADKVLVPSHWCQDVFKRSGIDSEVVPLGYNDDNYNYVEREDRLEKRQDFTFLHYNAYNIRKGFPEVFKAFVAEFAPDEPVKMIFKTTLQHLPFPISESEYPNIQVLQGQYSEQDLAVLCASADCFVFPSRGEGFGITPLEAMATGMSAIVPNAHGISEYFNPDFMYEVKVEKTCPGLYQRYKGQDVGQMVICSVDDLRKKMRWAYEHQSEVREKGRLASEYVKKWTYKETAQRLKEIVEYYYKQPTKPRSQTRILPMEQI